MNETIQNLIAPAASILALIYGGYLIRKVLDKDTGNEKMQKIAKAIQEGSSAYLSRQFKMIIPFVAVLFALIYWQLGLGSGLTFLLGASLSALSGYLGMWVAVRANVRTTAAAKDGMPKALDVAFKSGAVNGMLIAGLGLLGLSGLFLASKFWNFNLEDVLIGFGFGAALIALFMRVGGGIFTKAADVGADLVGKVEAGIPEDDPRNPAVIADNVGDNVGDCAGMGADVFESYSVTIVAAMLLGLIYDPEKGVIFALILTAGGILASILGTLFVKAKSNNDDPMKVMNFGFYITILAMILISLVSSYYIFDELAPSYAVITGLAAMMAILLTTQYYTGVNFKPVQSIAEASQTGAGTNLISGIGFGFESVFLSVLIVAGAIGLGYHLLGFYGISLVGIGILSVTGIVMSMDTMGPIADNADGIGEMAGLSEEYEKSLAPLDAVGNTTKALTKGFAIASAAVAAASLFATFFEKTGLSKINIGNPEVFVGLLIGGMIPFVFSSRLMMAVGRAAKEMVEEVRHQFKENPNIMKGKDDPDYARCVDISTQAAQRELIIPAAIVILTPVAIGLILKAEALGGFLGGAILSALCLAFFSCNAGAAWDNAKKFIEAGNLGGKGTETHKAAIVGDTVGDPLKDTSGPALNPMAKIINIVALLIVELIKF